MYDAAYQEFYSGENRKAMHKAFCDLIEMLRTDDFSKINEVLTQDCLADLSTVGHLKGIEEIKEKIGWPGPACNVSKITVWNFVARSHEDRGRMFAYVQCTRAIETDEDLYPFLFGGQFVNSFVKEDGIWKMDHIRFDLIYEEGNDLFVKDKWTTINYGLYSGHEPMVNAELDSPWRVIPDDDEKLSDEEEIFELMYKYAFVFDNADFEFMHTFVTDDFWINGSGEDLPYPDDPPRSGDFPGLRAVNDFLKSKHRNEAKMIHSCRMDRIEYEDENTVHAYMPRGEEYRLKNHNPDKESIHSMVTTAMHHIYAKKIDGIWRMYKYRITPELRFDPMSDEQIRYDEYIRRRKDNA
ncbi:MAG: nuclear transport factor 2 family protein [Erysipelotrichaceae bacterium]|nr:nuclear transport factor 2 family protein [Erysipelotrichaceae bacterium]